MVLFSVLLPVFISGTILFIAWRGWRRSEPIPNGTWGGPIALGLGYGVGHIGTIGFPPFPAVEATQWLLYFAFAATVFSLLESRWGKSGFVCFLIRGMLSAAIPWLLLRSMLKHTWAPIEGVAWLLGLSGAVFAFWILLDAAMEHHTGVTSPLTLLIVTLGSSVVLVLSGSALLGQLAGILGAAVGASLIVAWWRPKLTFAGGMVPVVAAMLAGLWLNGYFYAEAPAASILPLAIAPAMVWVRKLAPMRKLGSRGETVIAVAAVLAPVVLAVALAFQASPPIDYDY